MIIDVHALVWPDPLAPRVLAHRPAGLDPVGDGTVSGLLRSMDDAGVDASCCLAIANEARHVRTTNAFVGALASDRLVPFGTIHPGLSVEENLKSLLDNGIKGVKLHPNFQGISLADPAVVDVITALAENDLPVITHSGVGNDAAATERGHPRHIRRLVDEVAGLTMIACHYGGYHLLDAANESLVGADVILETSWPPRLADLGADIVRDLIERHGPARVVFGSDWPMANMSTELDTIRGLGLAAEDEALVLGEKVRKILHLGPRQGPTSYSASTTAFAPWDPS